VTTTLTPGAAQPEILVVDDTPENIELLYKMLNRQGFRIAAAPSGEIALKIAPQIQPSLILLDVMMPGIDGYETCRQLKANPKTCDIPVIFVTARNDESDLIKGFALGAADFIRKPIRTEELNARISTQLKVSSLISTQQKQLLQAQKLAQLGEQMAEMGHEVSTPIGIAVTAQSCMQEELIKLTQIIEEKRLSKSLLMDFIQTSEEILALSLSNIEIAANLLESFKRIAVDQCSVARRRFNLHDYLHQIVFSLGPKLKKTAISVNIDCDKTLKITSCPGELSQVITNLITNSITHAYDPSQQGEIDIRAERKNSTLKLSYADNGNGIPEEAMAKIFDKYYTSKVNDGGSGLGLYFVKNIVENIFHGTLHCASAPGEGTVFNLTLPLNSA
jgi:signal transduction histidine kinase